MSEKRVSVIILNYNGNQFIENLFKSLSGQTYKNFEVIFVDNASTDNSLKTLANLLKKTPFNRLDVKVVHNTKNLGYCGGNNAGVSYADSEYIVFLNNDTYVSQTWLEGLTRVMEHYKSLGACQSKLVSARTGELQCVGLLCDVYGESYFLTTYDVKSSIVLDGFFYCSGASVILRKAVLREIEELDEKLFFGDRDLGWRLRLRGYKVSAALDSVCYHYGGYSLKRFLRDTTITFHDCKDRIRVLVKNYSIIRLLRRLPLSLVLMFLNSLYFTLGYRRPHLFAFAKALFWNLRNLEDTLSERMKMQETRVASDDEVERRMYPYSFLIDGIKRKLSHRNP